MASWEWKEEERRRWKNELEGDVKKIVDMGGQYTNPMEKRLQIRQGLGSFHWNTHISHNSDKAHIC